MSSPLDGTTWIPVECPAGHASVTFVDGRVAGCAGINRFGGQASVERDRIRVGPLASTRMAGPPEAMAAEDQVLRALDATRRWEIVDDRLVLRDESGGELLVLAPSGGPDDAVV